MKTIIFTITFLAFSLKSLIACTSCITDISYNDPHIATRTVHPLKKADNCMCPCTGPRNDKNDCLECKHHVPDHHKKF